MKNTRFTVYFQSKTVTVYAINRYQACILAMADMINEGLNFTPTHIQSEYDLNLQEISIDFKAHN